jgi:hypothetical protein
MPNQVDEQQAREALEQITQETATTTRALELPSKEDLCDTYIRIRPLLEKVLPWIKRLPHGDHIAGAIEFLMKIAGAVCS